MAAIEKRESQKGTRWRAKVLVRYDPASGKTKYLSRTFGSKKEAEDWGREQDVLRSRNQLMEPTKETVAEYVRRHLDHVIRQDVRDRTYESYSRMLRRYLEDPPEGCPQIGHVRLDRFHAESLQRLYGWMTTERGLSPRMVRLLHSVIRPALARAARTGAAHRNEADLVDLPKVRKREPQAMTLEELRSFLSAAQGDHYAPLWVLLASTGMRPGECLGLKWEDIEWEGKRLRVRRGLSRPLGKPWQLNPPKTPRSRRTIVLPEATISTLRALRTDQAKARLKAGSDWTDHDFVFTTATGEPLDWSNVRRNWEKIMAEAGIGEWGPEPRKPLRGPTARRSFKPKYRAYALRHTHASLLLRGGLNAKIISERLGHFSVGFTLDTYVSSVEDLQHEAAEKMEELMSQAVGE